MYINTSFSDVMHILLQMSERASIYIPYIGEPISVHEMDRILIK